jgi:hypothetical protein
MISKIIYNNNFDKTIDFIKVMMSKIIYNNNNFDKTINFMKVMISKIIYDEKIFYNK